MAAPPSVSGTFPACRAQTLSFPAPGHLCPIGCFWPLCGCGASRCPLCGLHGLVERSVREPCHSDSHGLGQCKSSVPATRVTVSGRGDKARAILLQRGSHCVCLQGSVGNVAMVILSHSPWKERFWMGLGPAEPFLALEVLGPLAGPLTCTDSRSPL